jgi:hypothetical protein
VDVIDGWKKTLFLKACFKTIKAPVLKARMAELITAQNIVEKGSFREKSCLAQKKKVGRYSPPTFSP